ncbi:uncharacterized protein LOC111437446 isoform X2 [Cucurbita moschata]|uniref:Uncharacterized protein LOC111437446 isoform X2 n=1 Tax=Cucurbita moschata TaxID=3662 RepID=A0A6J1EYS3_CUCMO|nr:uncharacterized protein LOC111437446 isoform X2 [Cucurbita moschata]
MGKNRDRTRRSSAAELLETPPLTPPSATDSPKSAIFSRKINGNLHDLKRLVDHSHSQIVEDIESSNSRLQKRFKIQSQACQKMMDEVEKEKKKMSQRIYESQEAMKASYEGFWHMNRIVHIGFAKHP